jgi:hypothetical protein
MHVSFIRLGKDMHANAAMAQPLNLVAISTRIAET